MMIYRAIEAANARRVALVGIAKHAGKTTAMNALIEQASLRGRRLGIVSIGVDGERNDAIMGVPKPEVYVPGGTLVASAGDVLNAGTAQLSILASTGISSTLGDVYLAEVKQAGTVLLAGIRYAAQVEQVLGELEQLGADLCLVDGAFDRMMAASPLLTDGVVLATGGVVARTVSEVASKTRFFLHRFALPLADVRAMSLYDLAVEKGALVVGGESADDVFVLQQESTFTANPQTDPNWPGTERAKVLAVPGAVTDRLLKMLEGLPRGFTLVLADSSHFFATMERWRTFLRRGGQIVVRRQVQVLGMAVNPHSVAGYDLPRGELLRMIREIAGEIPVEDVKFAENEG
jgi:hypothetical protein